MTTTSERASMTPRERWQAVLARERIDRVPTDYWATGEVTERLMRELKCDDVFELYRKLHVDKLVSVGPRYVGPSGQSLWGLEFLAQEYGDGMGVYNEVASHPLAEAVTVKDIDEFDWPTADWFDFANIRPAIEQHRPYPHQAGHYEPFLLYCQLRGMERAFMDLAERPELLDAALGHIFDFHYTCNVRTFDVAGDLIEITYVAEDLGSQESLLMSEAAVDRFLKPKMREMIDLAHQHGIKVFHHSDGAIRPLIPGMIAIGIDILNPIQWRCRGMDRAELKREFGDHVVFHGAMDNQQTVPFGTTEDVRREVIENLRLLGAGGGYILAPCHNIQPITPSENILALYETTYHESRL